MIFRAARVARMRAGRQIRRNRRRGGGSGAPAVGTRCVASSFSPMSNGCSRRVLVVCWEGET